MVHVRFESFSIDPANCLLVSFGPARSSLTMNRLHQVPYHSEKIMQSISFCIAVTIIGAALTMTPREAVAQDAQIERGKYLVNLALCTDCHTPGFFFGKPDMTRFLGGSEV